MCCKKIEKLLTSYAHGECSHEETKRVSQHLGICTACRESLREFKALSTAVGNLKSPPLSEERLHEFYVETLRRTKQSGAPIRARKPRLAFKPVWTFAMIIILVVSAGIFRGFWQPVPELVIHENMTLSEIRELESHFQNRRIRSKWMDQPVPLSRWIALLTELQRLDRRSGSVTPVLEETLEQIIAETNPAPEERTPASFAMSTFTLNQSIDYIKQIRRYQSEITLRELAAFYAQVRRT